MQGKSEVRCGHSRSDSPSGAINWCVGAEGRSGTYRPPHIRQFYSLSCLLPIPLQCDLRTVINVKSLCTLHSLASTKRLWDKFACVVLASIRGLKVCDSDKPDCQTTGSAARALLGKPGKTKTDSFSENFQKRGGHSLIKSLYFKYTFTLRLRKRQCFAKNW